MWEGERWSEERGWVRESEGGATGRGAGPGQERRRGLRGGVRERRGGASRELGLLAGEGGLEAGSGRG